MRDSPILIVKLKKVLPPFLIKSWSILMPISISYHFRPYLLSSLNCYVIVSYWTWRHKIDDSIRRYDVIVRIRMDLNWCYIEFPPSFYRPFHRSFNSCAVYGPVVHRIDFFPIIYPDMPLPVALFPRVVLWLWSRYSSRWFFPYYLSRYAASRRVFSTCCFVAMPLPVASSHMLFCISSSSSLFFPQYLPW